MLPRPINLVVRQALKARRRQYRFRTWEVVERHHRRRRWTTQASNGRLETNPRKLPQLRSLNPQERRVIETARTTNLIDNIYIVWGLLCKRYIGGGIGRRYVVEGKCADAY